MTVEAAPVGVQCNLSCPYCYQHPLRDGGHAASAPANLPAMKATLLAQGQPFTLFGGEALLLPLPELTDLVEWGVANLKSVGLQTNGTLLTPEHVALFVRCRVHVGMSMDGPGVLNDMRWAGSEAKTREMTRRSEAALDALCAAGRPPSLIITLHQRNAGPAVRTQLLDWCRALYGKGLRAIRLHLLEVDHAAVGEKLALSEPDLQAVLDDFMALQADPDYPDWDFDLFREVIALLRGQDQRTSCVWHACDPFTTSAVNAVGPEGERVNCGRVEKSGVPWLKAATPGHERQVSLYETPQAEGGCQGCRFFSMCTGHCPGSAVDGDWRLRSSHCATLLWLFDRMERLLTLLGERPVSRRSDRLKIEQLRVDAWRQGLNLPLHAAIAHATAGTAPSRASATNAAHGDTPHGDSHGDHTDTRRRS
jgi:uncharacterized protein